MSTPVLTRDIISVQTVDTLAFIALAIIVAGVAYKLLQWRRVIPKGFMKEVVGRLGYGGVTSTAVRELASKLVANTGLFNEGWRRAVHLAMFWGFVGLMITTTWAYIVNPHADYRPITEPYRILGNVSGVVLLVSSSIALLRIGFSSRFRHARTWRDLTFLSALWLSTVTGFTTQYYREMAYTAAGDPIAGQLLSLNYQLHFILIGLLLVTAPFTSFMHAITTPLLRLYERFGNRIAPAVGLRRAKTTADISFIQRVYEEKQILKGVSDGGGGGAASPPATDENPELKDIQFFEKLYRKEN